MEESVAEGRLGWVGALGLLVATSLSAVARAEVLIAIPFGLLVVFLPTKKLLALFLAGAAAALVAMGDRTSGLWYLERGWALLLGGWFLVLSMRWPREAFLPRGLGAVLGAFAGMGMLFRVRPGDWTIVDWLAKSRIELTFDPVIQAIRMNRLQDGISEGFEAWVMDTVAINIFVFPALLGLSSLAALALAWWLFKKVTDDAEVGVRPLRDFRFNDQMVWVFIFGVAILLVSSGAMARIGTNAVVFMGALYAVRGAGVLLFLSGGVSLFGGILVLLGFLLMAPFMMMGAALFGLGDTWFDFRARRVQARPGA